MVYPSKENSPHEKKDESTIEMEGRFTNRTRDIVALILIAFAWLVMIGLIWRQLSYQWENETFIYTIKGLRKTVLLFSPSFLLAFGGLIFYFGRSKEIYPKHICLFSWDKKKARGYTALLFFLLIGFAMLFLVGLFIIPGDLSSRLVEVHEGYDGTLYTAKTWALDFLWISFWVNLILWLPLNSIGVSLWFQNKKKFCGSRIP